MIDYIDGYIIIAFRDELQYFKIDKELIKSTTDEDKMVPLKVN